MQQDVITKKKVNVKGKLNTAVKIAMLSAVAIVLMLLEFPLPFIAPPFYQLDFSEVPILIGAFAIGPMAGVAIEAIKILLNLVINGTTTAGVGELANFAIGCAFILPASIFYKLNKTRKRAFIGMIMGTIILALVGCFLNAYVLLPTYGKAFHMPVEAFIKMGQAIHPAINSMMSFVLLTVLPFNLIKGILVSLVVAVAYKRIHHLIR